VVDLTNHQNAMDLANAFFEGCGSIFILNHARVLFNQKLVRGVSILSVFFFSCWGIFNIFYYQHLEQQFSWYAGIAVLIANSIYLGMIIHYRSKENGI
jgi:hypothetical protein